MSEGEKIDLEETISSKGITLTPALTDLFRPTTKLLGKELRDFAKKKIDTIKERNRDKNLRFHLDKINEIVGNKGANANLQEDSENEQLLKNAEKLLESLEAVQDVEPSEKELSEIWQNLIASLRLGKNIPQHLITTLKALSPLEASILMQVKSKKDVGFPTKFFRLFRYVIFPLFGQNKVQGADKHYLELLKEKRLLKKTYLVEYFWVSIVFSVVIAYFYITKRIPEGFVFSEYPLDNSIMMIFMMFTMLLMFPSMIIVSVLVYGMNYDYGRYRLSWLGHEILKYAPNEDENKHNKANSADAKSRAVD